jgi:ubiquinol-cytochrome c reductase cytochrome b subunit
LIRGSVSYFDTRLGGAPLLRKTLHYVFPDHWSFMLGEIALYCFVVLVGTGIYLTFFFDANYAHEVYRGSYAPLRGTDVTKAFGSTMDLSYETKAGLLMRQAHHWAANLFLVAIVLHLLRIFFTGAFRRPRDLNAAVGVTMLALALLEGYAGYSLPDDLLSGMGLAIGYSVLLSVPVIGAWLAALVWGGAFPGGDEFVSRLYIAHVLLLPVAIALLITIHLAIIVRQKHAQFPGRGKTERNVVGTRLWPAYALRSTSLLLAVVAVVVLLGGLVQINPIWLWGPYHTYAATNGAQPDWYLGWLIGGLRLMPPLEIHVFGYTLVPNPFFGGMLFPLFVFGLLYAWPALERRITGDRARHELLDRPRDVAWRTALVAAFFTWVAVIFIAGSADQISVHFQIPYAQQVWFFRIAAFVAPALVYLVTRRVCGEIRARDSRPVSNGRRETYDRLTGAESAAAAPSPTNTDPET